jgi:hypothetical protein
MPATFTVVSSVAPSKNLIVPVGPGAPPTVGHATINTPIDVFSGEGIGVTVEGGGRWYDRGPRGTTTVTGPDVLGA